jgi:hypothetical protein
MGHQIIVTSTFAVATPPQPPTSYTVPTLSTQPPSVPFSATSVSPIFSTGPVSKHTLPSTVTITPTSDKIEIKSLTASPTLAAATDFATTKYYSASSASSISPISTTPYTAPYNVYTPTTLSNIQKSVIVRVTTRNPPIWPSSTGYQEPFNTQLPPTGRASTGTITIYGIPPPVTPSSTVFSSSSSSMVSPVQTPQLYYESHTSEPVTSSSGTTRWTEPQWYSPTNYPVTPTASMIPQTVVSTTTFA